MQNMLSLSGIMEYLQTQAQDVWEKLKSNLSCEDDVLSAEVQDHDRFVEQLQAASSNKQPDDSAGLADSLRVEQEKPSAVIRARDANSQATAQEHNSLLQELKLQEAQAQSRNNAILLQPLEGARFKTEPSLLRDNQKLFNTQRTEAKANVLPLEEACAKADRPVSKCKQAMQLLQTELQDTRAQMDEDIQSLKNKLRESEKKAFVSAVDLEELRSCLFKVELELRTSTEKHQQEAQKMSALLRSQEDSLRKLNEKICKFQQNGDTLAQEGEDFYANVTNPRGWVTMSSLSVEEEVQQLSMKIVQLESLVSIQEAEISEWKSIVIGLTPEMDADNLSPHRRSTKRGLATSTDSFDLLSSPKKLCVEDLQSPDKETGAAHTEYRKEFWSPKPEDICKMQ